MDEKQGAREDPERDVHLQPETRLAHAQVRNLFSQVEERKDEHKRKEEPTADVGMARKVWNEPERSG